MTRSKPCMNDKLQSCANQRRTVPIILNARY